MMSFGQFADVVTRNESAERPAWRHYLQVLLLWHGEDKPGCCDRIPAGHIEAAGERLLHASLGPKLVEDLTQLDFEWLRDTMEGIGDEGIWDVNLWVGASGGCTPLHYDTTCNLLTQLCGRKRLLLFPPSQTYLL